jgi:hypothetical protein
VPTRFSMLLSSRFFSWISSCRDRLAPLRKRECTWPRHTDSGICSSNRRHFLTAGSSGGCKLMRSWGTSGTLTMVDTSSPFWSAYRLLSSSSCSIFSGVKSRQKGGGSGKVADSSMACCCSAILFKAGDAYHI